MQSLWPDTFVEEANLSYQISTLRKALGDDGARWIETVPKHGYRFAGELAPPKPEEAAPQRRRIPWVIPAALAIVAGAALFFVKIRPAGEGSTPGAPVPLTAFPGIQTQPSLSPDGSQVAFTWNGPNGDNFDIYVKLVGPGEPVRLTTDPLRDYCPAWSPDGRQIAFVRFVNGQRAMLFVIPALGGGMERKLADLELPDILPDSVLSWAPDSRHIVAGARFRKGEPWGIWLVPVEGGSPERLTTAGAELAFDSASAFSPDGRLLAFIRFFAEKNRSEIWVRNSNGDIKQVTSESGAILSLAWIDNRRIVYTAGGGPSGQARRGIRVVEPGSSKPPVNPGFGESAVAVSVSRNGNLVYARQQKDVNLWRFDLADPSASRQRLAPSTYQNWTPAYSHDGKRVAFVSTRSGREEIWVADADGSRPVQVTRIGSRTSNPRWSPDDQSLVFNSWNPRSELYSVNLSDGLVERLTDDPGNQLEPSWSRNGKWIYCGSSRTGRLEIHRVPAGGGRLEQITRNGGLHAEESFDGKWLYYSKDAYSPTSIWKVPRDGGEESRVIEGVSYSSNFVPVEKGIYFISGALGQDGRSAIEFYEFDTGRTKALATTDKSLSWGLALSPDGRFLLQPLVDHVSNNLMLVENFR
jgi:Tol biopolymer transport system component